MESNKGFFHGSLSIAIRSCCPLFSWISNLLRRMKWWDHEGPLRWWERFEARGVLLCLPSRERIHIPPGEKKIPNLQKCPKVCHHLKNKGLKSSMISMNMIFLLFFQRRLPSPEMLVLRGEWWELGHTTITTSSTKDHFQFMILTLIPTKSSDVLCEIVEFGFLQDDCSSGFVKMIL